jgi:hypothetical protein
MMTKRFLLTLVAFALMLPLTGCCGCRRHCNSSTGMAPPAGACCPQPAAPGYIPGPPQ